MSSGVLRQAQDKLREGSSRMGKFKLGEGFGQDSSPHCGSE